MHETLDWLTRLAAAECLFAAWGYTAFAVAGRLLPSSGLALRWTAAAVVGLWQLSVGFHLLLALSAFTLTWGLGLALIAGLVAFFTCGGRVPLQRLVGDLNVLLDSLARRGRPLAGWLAMLAGVFTVLLIAVRATLVPVVAWDSLTYHAVKAALWVQRGGPLQLEAPGGFSIYRDYPGGGELLHAWGMLPLSADLLTGVVDAVTWLLLGVAVHALGAQFGLSLRARFVAAAYVLAVPAVARAAGSLYVDNALALALVAACALSLRWVRQRDPGSLILACMALGVGVGIKIMALPVAGAVAVSLFLVYLSRTDRPRVLGAALAGAAALLAAAAPWFVSTWMRSGYPLSPFPLRIGGITLGQANPALLWYMDRPAIAAAGLVDELRALVKIFGIPGFSPISEPTLGAASLAVVALAVLSTFRWVRRDGRATLVTLAFALPLVASFYGAGLRNTRLIWASVSGRYLIVALALCVVLSLACCRRNGAWQTGYQGLLWIAAAAYFAFTDVRGWMGSEVLVASAGALVLLGLALVRPRFPPRVAPYAAALLLLASAGLLGVYRETTRERALRHSVVLHGSPRYWVEAAAAVDTPGQPRVVAVTAGPHQDNDNWLLYPFLGSRFQNFVVYVPVTADGSLADLAPGTDRLTRASYEAWQARLAARGVTEVFSFTPRSVELVWMESRPAAFRRLAGDGRRWGLYQVAPDASGD